MEEKRQTNGFIEPTHPEELLRHIVGILVPIDLSKADREAIGRRAAAEIATGIVVSISEQWFLISAGHLVDDLRERHQQGHRLLTCRLISMASSEREASAIQFGLFDPQSPTFLNTNLIALAINKIGLDCLVVAVNKNLRDLLEHRGVQALHESTWVEPPSNPNMHYLVGFPASLAQLSEDKDLTQVSVNLQLIAPIVPIYPTPEPPEKLMTPSERLFFHLPKVNGTSDGKPRQFDHPGGMSGGPIIAARVTGETEIEACVVGIQSSWDKDTRVIAATPWPLVVHVVEKLIEHWKDAFDSIPTLGSSSGTGAEHPLAQFAGCMKDDPLYDEWQAAVTENRASRDQGKE